MLTTAYPTLPYQPYSNPTLPLPIALLLIKSCFLPPLLPYPTLPYPTITPNPTLVLPGAALPYPTLPYPTLTLRYPRPTDNALPHQIALSALAIAAGDGGGDVMVM